MKSLKSTFLNRVQNTKKRGKKRRQTLKGGIAKIPSPPSNTRTRVIPLRPRVRTRRIERREILPVQKKKGKFGYYLQYGRANLFVSTNWN